ncbi:hypothetical protein Emed_003439 [Eimeria media]
MFQLGSAGGPPQSVAPISGVEKASDNVRLLHSSAEGVSMPRQARHRVFHRTLLGAATAYVAILAVALLILVGEGGEEESVEEDEPPRENLIQQAKQNIESFKEAVERLKLLKSGAAAIASRAATSLYILLICEMGLLGGFADRELRRNKAAKRKRRVKLGMRRWVVLQKLVKVQAVTASIANKYLSIIHPDSGAIHFPGRQALSLLAALAEARRTMLLAEPLFAAYFEGFPLQGLARQRFGPSCGRIARAANPPLHPDAQIRYLHEHFPEDLSTQPSGIRAGPTSSPPGATPSSEQEAPTMHPRGPPLQPQSPPIHPQRSPVQTPSPPLQPSAPPSASGPGSHGSHFFAQLGARPKTSSQGTASSGQKSGLMSSKQASPGDPKAVRPSLPSPPGKEVKQSQGKAPGSRHPDFKSEVWNVGPRLRQRKFLEANKWERVDAASSSKEETSPGLWPEAEGGVADEPQGVPDGEMAQGLAALSVGKEGGLTADDGGEAGEGIDPSDDSTVHPSQTTQVPLPTQGQHASLSAPWSSPATPVSPHMPGVMPPLPPLVGPFFGVPQGMPRPTLPIPRPSVPLGFWEPPRPSGPAPHTEQTPPRPPGMSTGVSDMSPFVRPHPPPGFAGPQQPGGFVRQTWQRQSRPSGPLTSTSGGPVCGPLLGTIQHPFPRAPPPPFPSMPSPSELIPPSPSQPSVEGPPHSSPSVPSGPGPLSPFFGPPSIWSPLSPSTSKLSFSGSHPGPSSQPSLMGPSSSGLSTLAVPWHPSADPTLDQEEPKSRISGAFHGTPMGEPTPSSTSVTTAPPPS